MKEYCYKIYGQKCWEPPPFGPFSGVWRGFFRSSVVFAREIANFHDKRQIYALMIRDSCCNNHH
ncbi:MAG TPA: hypothetical protein PKH80_07580 [Methanofastidiosum sp.]|nr:hypothetical protein [Methanofastidiosum sp.]